MVGLFNFYDGLLSFATPVTPSSMVGSTFIQFGGPSGAIINLDYLTGLSYGERVATAYDAEQRGEREGWPKVGQVLYYIDYSVAGASTTKIEFVSKKYRDNCYSEIVAMIRPITIGAIPPPDSTVPTFSAPNEITELEQAASPDPATPPRKPRTPR